jgi:hypothetical protein
MSKQNANAVEITGGTITGISPLLVAFGGTSSNTPAGARNNLGLGNIATQNSDEVTITGGTINNAVITGGTVSNLITPLSIASGGTSGNTAASARTGLGLGTISTQNADNINISGGNISVLNTPLAIGNGGTGASNSTAARTNLGLGTIAIQNAANVTIGNVTIDSGTVGNLIATGTISILQTPIN